MKRLRPNILIRCLKRLNDLSLLVSLIKNKHSYYKIGIHLFTLLPINFV